VCYNSGSPAPVALAWSGPVPKSNSRCSLPLVKSTYLDNGEEPIARGSFLGVDTEGSQDGQMLQAHSERQRMPLIQQSRFVSAPCQVFGVVDPLEMSSESSEHPMLPPPTKPSPALSSNETGLHRPSSALSSNGSPWPPSEQWPTSSGAESPVPQLTAQCEVPPLDVEKQKLDEELMKTLKYQARKTRRLAERIGRGKNGVRDYRSGLNSRPEHVRQDCFCSDPCPVQQSKFVSDGVKSAPVWSPRGDPSESEICCKPPSMATLRSKFNTARLRRLSAGHHAADEDSVNGTSSGSTEVEWNTREGRSKVRLPFYPVPLSRQTSPGSACLDSPTSFASSRSCISERWKVTGSEGCESEHRMWTLDSSTV